MKIIKGHLGNSKKLPVWKLINDKGEVLDWFDRLTETIDGLTKDEVIYILGQRKINLNQDVDIEKYRSLIVNAYK